jgi:hypothetical protein
MLFAWASTETNRTIARQEIPGWIRGTGPVSPGLHHTGHTGHRAMKETICEGISLKPTRHFMSCGNRKDRKLLATVLQADFRLGTSRILAQPPMMSCSQIKTD